MAVTHNNEPLLIDPALLHQARQRALQRLEHDPDNRGVLRSLAEVHRKLGDVREAAAAYGRVFQLDPHDRDAGYMAAALEGSPWPIAPAGLRAAPLVVVRDFLPSGFHDGLIPLLTSLRDKLAPALVGDGTYAGDYRETLDYMQHWEGREQFTDHLREILSGVGSRLSLAPFTIKGVEAYLRAYMDGHFFKVHSDAPLTPPRSSRVVSFVYYFHRRPRPFTGGELLLFDSDILARQYTTARFTRVVPEDNVLVLFPSAFFHCVLPVHCRSGEFQDSRFVINGFVQQRGDTMPAVDGAVTDPGRAAAPPQHADED